MFDVDRNRAMQDSGLFGPQGRSNAVTTELRRPVVAELGQPLTNSSYRSKGHKSSHLQPVSSPAIVPLIIVSPGVDRRELPEFPHDQKTHLEVNVEASRSQLGSNATSGNPESPSSTTRAISSTLEAAAVAAVVASSCADDSPVVSPFGANNEDSVTTRSSRCARSVGPTIVQDQCLSGLVVVLLCDDFFLMLYFRQAVRSTVVATPKPGAQTRLERVELDGRVSGGTQLDVAVQDSWTLENKGSSQPRSSVGPQLSGLKPYTTQYLVGRDDAGASGRSYVPTKGTHVDGIEKNIIRSSHGDMIQIQPSDDGINNRYASRESR